jgi:glycerate kinase|tara:strand:+ start:120 stop:332 length:213 start_codon:yes stop_codon:yes gene_type:complete
MKEANLISFKVLINSKGQVVTELSGLPEEKIDQVFKTKHDKTMMRKIIKESKVKLEKMHSYLEGELEALN